MTSKNTLWECPLRTKAKLEILRHYLGAWFSILARKGYPHVFYVDGFCGPGQYLGGEEGSPLIAARFANSTAQKNSGFRATLIFIDKDKNSIEHLKSLDAIKNHHPNITIDIRECIFADEIDEIIKKLQKHPDSPTFSFVDPFGFGQTPLDKIQLLMHNQSSELFVNFMCGFMNRFKEHPSQEVVDRIKGMIGTDNLNDISEAHDPIDELCIVYEQKLKNIGAYTLKFMMRDEMNIRDNAFFFCGRNPTGFKKIKEAMWKVDPINGNAFSAHLEISRDQAQNDLFGIANPETHSLSKLIYEEFSGKVDVPVKDIFKWVVENTETYLDKHARRELENLYIKGKITNVLDPEQSFRKRRKGAWPERLLISFSTKK